MTTDQKKLFKGALSLPRTMKAKLAQELLSSLEEAEMEKAIVEGAKLAHKRIQACLKRKEKTISEEEIMALLDRRR